MKIGLVSKISELALVTTAENGLRALEYLGLGANQENSTNNNVIISLIKQFFLQGMLLVLINVYDFPFFFCVCVYFNRVQRLI